MSSMTIHMFRIFFTGAFRKPRELNWLIGLGLITLGLVEGFAGYSLPDDLLSGTGLRIAEAIMQSIPIIGTWVAFLVFGGKFPGTEIIGITPRWGVASAEGWFDSFVSAASGARSAILLFVR